MTCKCGDGCGCEPLGTVTPPSRGGARGQPAVRVTLDYDDESALASIDPDELAKSLSRIMRKAGVGSKVAGQMHDQDYSPFPAVRETLLDIQEAAQAAALKMGAAIERVLKRASERK